VQAFKQRCCAVERGPAHDQAAIVALPHEIMPPFGRLSTNAAFDGEDAAIGNCGHRCQAGERATLRFLEPARHGLFGINSGKPTPGDANQKAPVGMERKSAGIGVELRNLRAGCKACAR
jgi:hypothetical protein